MKTNATFQLLEESVANPKYNLDKALSLIFDGGSYYERTLKNYFFICVDGDAVIDGDLRVDYKKGWSTDSIEWRGAFNINDDQTTTKNFGIRGLIVNGNLNVNGSIINSDSDSGPFLYVTGDVQANNLVIKQQFFCSFVFCWRRCFKPSSSNRFWPSSILRLARPASRSPIASSSPD
jgi:hypothetical protein